MSELTQGMLWEEPDPLATGTMEVPSHDARSRQLVTELDSHLGWVNLDTGIGDRAVLF